MRRLAALERALERLFERPTVRLFGAPLEGLTVQRRIERVLEEGRRSEGGRTVLPDGVAVRIHPDDLPGLGDPTELADRLANSAMAFARSHGYGFEARPVVRIVADPGVGRGEPVASVAEGGPPAVVGARGVEGTSVFVPPIASGPAARLVVTDRRGRREIQVSDGPVFIGRAEGNDVVVDDPGVSRRHARLAVRDSHLVLTDLGSSNGTWLGGRRVAEIVLGPGDRVALGGASIVVEPVGED